MASFAELHLLYLGPCRMAFLTSESVYVSLTSQHRFSDIVAAIVINVDFLVSSPHGRPFHELQTNADCTQGSND